MIYAGFERIGFSYHGVNHGIIGLTNEDIELAKKKREKDYGVAESKTRMRISNSERLIVNEMVNTGLLKSETHRGVNQFAFNRFTNNLGSNMRKAVQRSLAKPKGKKTWKNGLIVNSNSEIKRLSEKIVNLEKKKSESLARKKKIASKKINRMKLKQAKQLRKERKQALRDHLATLNKKLSRKVPDDHPLLVEYYSSLNPNLTAVAALY